jgi:hypothetical protein
MHVVYSVVGQAAGCDRREQFPLSCCQLPGMYLIRMSRTEKDELTAYTQLTRIPKQTRCEIVEKYGNVCSVYCWFTICSTADRTLLGSLFELQARQSYSSRRDCPAQWTKCSCSPTCLLSRWPLSCSFIQPPSRSCCATRASIGIALPRYNRLADHMFMLYPLNLLIQGLRDTMDSLFGKTMERYCTRLGRTICNNFIKLTLMCGNTSYCCAPTRTISWHVVLTFLDHSAIKPPKFPHQRVTRVSGSHTVRESDSSRLTALWHEPRPPSFCYEELTWRRNHIRRTEPESGRLLSLRLLSCMLHCER